MKKILLALSLSAFLFACGGGEKKAEPEMAETTEQEAPAQDQTEMKQEEAPAEESTEEANPNMTVLTIEGNDMMKFNLAELKAEAGKEVKLVLKHVGKLDAKVMGHNWVLLKKGTDLTAFATAAMKATETEYIPNDGAEVIAHTSVIGGGEETEVTFMAPEKGEYTFVCSFPGHYSMMQGKFIVE